jgi:hypothetical protein
VAVSKRLRYEILRRDENTCRYCGGRVPDVVLTVDHVVPTALGGSDDPSNLVAACKDCNAGKTSSSPDAPLVADVAEKAVQWAQAITRWARQRIDDRYERDCYVDQFTDAWDIWGYGPDDDRKQVPKPGGWKATIWQFYETGLPVEELEDAITIACGRDRVQLEEKFRYMCGVAWKQVEKMHQDSRTHLAAAADEPGAIQDHGPTLESEYSRGAWKVFGDLGYSDVPNRILLSVIEGCSPEVDRAYGISKYRWVA